MLWKCNENSIFLLNKCLLGVSKKKFVYTFAPPNSALAPSLLIWPFFASFFEACPSQRGRNMHTRPSLLKLGVHFHCWLGSCYLSSPVRCSSFITSFCAHLPLICWFGQFTTKFKITDITSVRNLIWSYEKEKEKAHYFGSYSAFSWIYCVVFWPTVCSWLYQLPSVH